MKRLLSMALICIALTSCGTTDESDNSNQSQTTTETTDTTKTTNTTETTDATGETENTDENKTENNSESTADATTTPSITGDSTEVVKSLSENGNWITAITTDVDVTEEIVVSGTFYDKDDTTKDIYRKLALYTQDSERNVTGTFTLSTPKMTVESENFRIQEGTLKGDVYVKANGFELKNATIDGNITFESDEFKESAKLDEGVITGEVK